MQDWIDRCETGRFWIANARLVDPASERVVTGALHVADGRIAGRREGAAPEGGDPVLDAGGLHLAPGLVDMHVHLREPGREDRETVATGSRAAARGGVTTMACMPNTDPPVDSGAMVRFVREKAAAAGLCRVLPVGAVTLGQAGRQLADLGEMHAAGAVAFSDDGLPVADAALLRHAMEHALTWDLLLISHAEEPALSQGGHMHEGAMATRLGLKGIPRESEDVAVDRDLRLAGMTGARLHIAHVSSRGAVDILRRAKAAGVRATAEVTPHHLLLTDADLADYDPHKKMNPPLREAADQEALVQGLLDGTLDCVATDHAPHTEVDKGQEFAAAPFGVTGLETALAAVLTRLVATGLMPLPRALALLTSRPAAILGIEAGRLDDGAPADLVLFDPAERWTVRGAETASLAANTAFEGMELTGRVRATFLGGRPIYLREAAGASTPGAEHWYPRPWREEAARA
ncbi:MAG: dihydroorotase [Candidatus Krumholzibacteriota bacterium]|nr:dihydroorotase [Candidatus Krumholzibacteriota bacterium]